jgi:hypothetical protein
MLCDCIHVGNGMNLLDIDSDSAAGCNRAHKKLAGVTGIELKVGFVTEVGFALLSVIEGDAGSMSVQVVREDEAEATAAEDIKVSKMVELETGCPFQLIRC